MHKIAFSIAAILTLAACAKDPDKIAAADIGSGAYRGASCQQLATKKLETSQALESLNAQQKSAASNDALGVFLLGLPLSSMSGGDKEAQISIAKGHIAEIEREQDRKRCRAA